MSTDVPRSAHGPHHPRPPGAHRRGSTPAAGATGADTTAARQDLPDLVAFLLGTGLRIGEACAVRPTDLDLRRGPGAGARLVGRRGQPRQSAEG